MKTGIEKIECASLEDKYTQPLPDLLTVMSVCNKAQIEQQKSTLLVQNDTDANKKSARYRIFINARTRVDIC